MNIKKIHIIVNPASGKTEPILPILNETMKEANVEWEVLITKKSGDGIAFAKDAIQKKADVVAAYGGDGTIAEVAMGLMGSTIPLAVLPGGSGNVFSKELDIPQTLKEACELITKGPHEVRDVDMLKMDDRYLILRASLGFEAEIVKGAKRETKKMFGMFAYSFSLLASLKKVKLVRYDLTIDGEKHSVEGLTCIITNSANLGLSNVTIDKTITVDDGLIDVIVFKKATINLFAFFIQATFKQKLPKDIELVRHWQGKSVSVTSTPKQFLQCDGEIVEKGSVNITVVPKAVRVLCPLKNA